MNASEIIKTVAKRDRALEFTSVYGLLRRA